MRLKSVITPIIFAWEMKLVAQTFLSVSPIEVASAWGVDEVCAILHRVAQTFLSVSPIQLLSPWVVDENRLILHGVAQTFLSVSPIQLLSPWVVDENRLILHTFRRKTRFHRIIVDVSDLLIEFRLIANDAVE